MARPRTPLLNRDLIRDTALALIDEHGLTALSMRRLAQELGVQAASLYSHYPTKDGVLDAVADLLTGRVDASGFAGGDWRAGLTTWARSYHAALAAHPNAVAVVASGTGRREPSLAMADAVHAALVEAGWPPRHATMITGAVTYLVIGAASTPSGTGFDLGLAALVRGLEDEFAEAVEWRRAPGEGRYARTERERRFLVRRLPPDLGRPRRIEDRYLDGTRLRLRHVREGEESVFKLTQKVRRAGGPADVAITNTYLTAEEHRTLSLLPGAPLAKSRYEWRSGAHVFVVDEFHGRLEGLWLAEVEVAALDAALTLPEWAGREVSHDDRFSGGHLATADAAECAEIVRLARSDAG